jgi:hypothetical protein
MARINLQLRQFVIVPLNVEVAFYAYFRQTPPQCSLVLSLFSSLELRTFPYHFSTWISPLHHKYLSQRRPRYKHI